MAKYATDDSSGGGNACELCGRETGDLTTATVAGAELELCAECVPHGERTGNRERSDHDSHGTGSQRQQGSGQQTGSRQRAARNAARLTDAGTGDSTRWEKEGTNYDDDQLPYLVSGYGDRTRAAREDERVGIEELADELDLAANAVRAVEEGDAARADVGGSVIAALENRLDVQLAEE